MTIEELKNEIRTICSSVLDGCNGCPISPLVDDRHTACVTLAETKKHAVEAAIKAYRNGKDTTQKAPETRREILQAAERCVCGGRELDHGAPEQSFQAIALHFTAFLESKDLLKEGAKIDAADAAAMLALFKVARVAAGNFVADSYVDACGYLACSGEIASEREKEG